VLNTPIILSVFNRPESTARVFEAIAQAQPRQLFVFADGPRSAAEADHCAEARAVVENVEWACDVRYHYSETNLGARECYKAGVDWAFSEVDEGIILDDDCVPDPTFFVFSQDMLEQYRHDPRVMMICGTNYLGHWKEDRQSYTSPTSEACGAGPRGSEPGRPMTQVCRPGETRGLRNAFATFSPTMRSTHSRLSDSIVSIEILKIVTRGTFHGAWRDSSTQVLLSFPLSTSSRTLAMSTDEACLRTIPSQIWRLHRSYSHCGPRVRSSSTGSMTGFIRDGSSNGSRSKRRLTPTLTVVHEPCTSGSLNELGISDTAS